MQADEITYQDGVLNVVCLAEDTTYQLKNETLTTTLRDKFKIPVLFKNGGTFLDVYVEQYFMLNPENKTVLGILECIDKDFANTYGLPEQITLEIDPLRIIEIFNTADKDGNRVYYRLDKRYEKIRNELIAKFFEEKIKNRDIIVPIKMFSPFDPVMFVEVLLNNKVIMAAHCFVEYSMVDVEFTEGIFHHFSPVPSTALNGEGKETFWFGDEKTFLKAKDVDMVLHAYNQSNNEVFTFRAGCDRSLSIEAYTGHSTRIFPIPTDRDDDEAVEKYISDKLIEAIMSKPAVTSLNDLF